MDSIGPSSSKESMNKVPNQSQNYTKDCMTSKSRRKRQ